MLMRTYHLLSRVPFLKNHFNLKILFVAFVGIHIPLFAIIAYLVGSQLEADKAWLIGALTLVFTLLATLGTLLILNGLLKPVLLAKKSLNNYIRFAKPSNLPKVYTDEAGVLMQDIQKAIEALESLDQQQLEALQLLSHDLQSPLRTALGILNFVKDEKDQDFVREHHNLIEESLQGHLKELEALLEELKSLRLAGDTDTPIQSVSLKEWLNRTQERFKNGVQERSMHLQIHNEIDELEIPLKAAKKSLNNIISNAIKYGEPGSTIELETQLEDSKLSISVKNQGRGFKPEDAAKIFKYNLSLAQSQEAEAEDSHGVGLSLCQSMMHRAGGMITAHSDGLGLGATFGLIMPCKVIKPSEV